jgi:hypothetical protein
MKLKICLLAVICVVAGLLVGFIPGLRIGYIRGSAPPPPELAYRQGTLEIPVESAPHEVREAGKLWGTRGVKVIARVSSGGYWYATYHLEVSMKEPDYESRKAQFRQKLEEGGWHLTSEPPHGHETTWSSGDRNLEVRYDFGRDPTYVILVYTRKPPEEGQQPD